MTFIATESIGSADTYMKYGIWMLCVLMTMPSPTHLWVTMKAYLAECIVHTNIASIYSCNSNKWNDANQCQTGLTYVLDWVQAIWEGLLSSYNLVCYPLYFLATAIMVYSGQEVANSTPDYPSCCPMYNNGRCCLVSPTSPYLCVATVIDIAVLKGVGAGTETTCSLVK